MAEREDASRTPEFGPRPMGLESLSCLSHEILGGGRPSFVGSPPPSRP